MRWPDNDAMSTVPMQAIVKVASKHQKVCTRPMFRGPNPGGFPGRNHETEDMQCKNRKFCPGQEISRWELCRSQRADSRCVRNSNLRMEQGVWMEYSDEYVDSWKCITLTHRLKLSSTFVKTMEEIILNSSSSRQSFPLSTPKIRWHEEKDSLSSFLFSRKRRFH